MKWLITGAAGMVASDLKRALTGRGEDVVALSKSDLDITSTRRVQQAIGDARPDVIVNCAAWTRVDDAETNEPAANAINGSAVGTKRTPYEINDRTAPLSAYGRSKLLGEIAAAHAERHVVLRSSWLFGHNGPNFVEAIRRQIVKGTNPLRVVEDQKGRPTYTPHLAEATIRIAHSEANGIFHYADEPECTWFDFARAIVEELGAAIDVKPVGTAEFPRPATRPAYSVLSTERYERVTGVRPASWREGLHEYLLA